MGFQLLTVLLMKVRVGLYSKSKCMLPFCHLKGLLYLLILDNLEHLLYDFYFQNTAFTFTTAIFSRHCIIVKGKDVQIQVAANQMRSWMPHFKVEGDYGVDHVDQQTRLISDLSKFPI